MKKSTRFFKRTVAYLLGILMLSQAFCLPAFAETKTAPASDLYLANADIQVSDDYLPETAYTSEIENPELGETDIGGADYYLEVEPREYPDGLVQRATVGDPMVYLTQVWLNQEYGDVPGFGEVEVNGKTGWDTVYGLLRALQHELGITDLANNFGSTTERLYSQNPLHRQDGVTNRKFAILQGALWCKGYSPGYHLRENADGTVEFDEVFDAGVEAAVIELKQDAGLTNPDGVVTTNVMKALMSMDSFKLLTGQLKITVTNQGFETITSAMLNIRSNSIAGNILESFEIPTLNPQEEKVFTYSLTDELIKSSDNPAVNLLYLQVESSVAESNYNNNSQEISVYSIELTAGTGGTVQGTGVYAGGTNASLSAIPEPGYIFDGWYEDGQKLYSSPHDYEFEINADRILEARFIPNNLTITDIEIFGTLGIGDAITFTTTAEGGNDPYQWEFYIYKDGEICYSNSESTINFFEWTPETTGDYNLVVNVIDATGFKVTHSTEFSVT